MHANIRALHLILERTQGRLYQAALRILLGFNLVLTALSMAACSEQSPRLEANVQGGNLFYGLDASFTIGVSRLADGLSVRVQSCDGGQAPVSKSATEIVYQCKLKATGVTQFEIVDTSGQTVFTKAFNVPAPRVVIESSEGDIEVELNPNKAPVSVDNFLAYVQAGFYQDLIFHRVIPGFVVQGGGFESGLQQRAALFPPINLETNRGLSNSRASIAMARTNDPNSATSQFFVNLVDNVSLDFSSEISPGYAVFGQVVRGMEVIDTIASKPTGTVSGFSDVPVTDIVIKKLTRIQ